MCAMLNRNTLEQASFMLCDCFAPGAALPGEALCDRLDGNRYPEKMWTTWRCQPPTQPICCGLDEDNLDQQFALLFTLELVVHTYWHLLPLLNSFSTHFLCVASFTFLPWAQLLMLVPLLNKPHVSMTLKDWHILSLLKKSACPFIFDLTHKSAILRALWKNKH